MNAMNLDKIKTQTTWSDTAASLNTNFAKLKDGMTALENATYKSKGYFKTKADLEKSYPAATTGSRAFVGAAYPYAIYLWDNEENAWIDSGEVGGDEQVNLDDFYTKEETHEAIKDEYEVISQEAYDRLPSKEEKLYFCYEED
jgi:hypothetical protein